MIKQLLGFLIIATLGFYLYLQFSGDNTIPQIPLNPSDKPTPIEDDIYQFDGTSFAWLQIKKDDQSCFQFKFDVKTKDQKSFLFSNGNCALPTTNPVFFGVMNEKGILVTAFGSNGKLFYIDSKNPINDDKWHTIIIDRCGSVWSVKIDGEIIGNKDQDIGKIQTGFMYFGNKPSDCLKPVTSFGGSKGCFKNVFVNGKQILFLTTSGIVKKTCN